MVRTRQPSYACMHTTTLALLVFAVTALSTVKLTEACNENISVPVNLKDERCNTSVANKTQCESKNLKELLKEGVNKSFESDNIYCDSSLTNLASSTLADFPGVIADLHLSTSGRSAIEDFYNKLLDGIVYHYNKTADKNYTMSPASRVFVVSFNVSNPKVTDNELIKAVKNVLEEDGRVRVMVNKSVHRQLRIWMNMNAKKYPSVALEPLAIAVQNGSINGTSVSSTSFLAFSAFPKTTNKEFEVKFDYSIAECDESKIADKNSSEYKDLEKNVTDFLNKTLNNIEGYNGASVTSLKCGASKSRSRRAVSDSTVQVVAKVTTGNSLNPSSIMKAFRACDPSNANSQVTNLQVKLLNPSSSDEAQAASIGCPTMTTTVPPKTKLPKTPTSKTEASTQPSTMGKTPRLFVRLRLALTWSQFCSKLEESLKSNIARNVIDKKGNRVSSDRVIFINRNKNCADPSKANDQVDLWFYITSQTGSEKPSKCITLKAYRVLKMIADNGNTKMLGKDFEGKIVSLNLAGCDAKEFENKNKMNDWTLILIIIALIVGAVLLFLACCCICCGAARRRRRRRHRDKYSNVEMVVVDVDGKPQANGEGGKGRGRGRRHHRRGSSGGRGYGYGYSDSDDNDDYLCIGSNHRRGHRKGRDYDGDNDRRRKKSYGGEDDSDGNLNGVDGAGKKNRGHRKGRDNDRRGRGRDGGYDSDDSDVDYLCGGRRRGRRRRKDKDDKMDKNKSTDDAGDGKGHSKGNTGNNNFGDSKDDKGKENAGYEDLRFDNDKQGGGQPVSYQNLGYGLGDRKPSADGGYTSLLRDGRGDNTYSTVNDSGKRQSRGGSVGSHNYEKMTNGATAAGAGAGGTGAEAGIAGTGGAAPAGGAAGLLTGSMADGNKRGSLTPAIVTSPAPDNGPQKNMSTSGSPTLRRESGSKGGSPTASRPSSGSSLRDIDDELQRERRRSSIHSLIDDDAEPLKHKTATVGIVGLALRNKNEKKKETEFKNLDKEMPALGTYPANTAGKNRNPDILPNPRSRVKLSSTPDYINASYLHDHKGQRRYIATQHPLLETKDDFWQMVWEQESYLIVMVNDDENSKQMDYPQYWPADEGSSVDFNGIVVSNKQVITKTDYVITNLVVTNSKSKSSAAREISHYRYTSWKEKDVPNIAMFVGFVVAAREIGRKYEDGKSPIVVHCSDGQGFTGVFVALDIGIRSHEENKTSVVDLFELAKRLRQGRSGIIGSLQLYNYAYQCLYEYTVNYDEEAEKKKEQNSSANA